MSKKWLWLTIGVVAVGGFVAGVVVAQEARKYPYLPEKYSEAYTPTLAEWRGIVLCSICNSSSYLTDRLLRCSMVAVAKPAHLFVNVDTKTQPGWNTYLGNGRFSCSDREVRAAYEEAAAEGMQFVWVLFPEISESDVQIEFQIQGALVGTWQGGKMTLEGEE